MLIKKGNIYRFVEARDAERFFENGWEKAQELRKDAEPTDLSGREPRTPEGCKADSSLGEGAKEYRVAATPPSGREPSAKTTKKTKKGV